MLFVRGWRTVLTVLALLALCPLSHAVTSPKVIPLRANVSFTATQSAQFHWSVPIKSTDGHTVYVLSLEPDVSRTAAPHLEGLSLVLRRPHEKADSQNLLSAIRNWHGVQDFMFPAWDYKDGVKGSTYGDKRTIFVKKLGLVVRITVSKAAVSLSPKYYQLDALSLKIEVDNAQDLPPSGLKPSRTTDH